MSTTVEAIMNGRLLYVEEGTSLKLVRTQILRFGVTSVPVLDAGHRPVGMLSLRDFALDDDPTPVTPVKTIAKTATVDEGAKALVDADLHRLVVVDEAGAAVGIVSARDFLREKLGLPPKHPSAFERVRVS